MKQKSHELEFCLYSLKTETLTYFIKESKIFLYALKTIIVANLTKKSKGSTFD